MRWGWKQWVGIVLIIFMFGVWQAMRRDSARRNQEPVVTAQIKRESLDRLANVPLGDAFLRASAKAARQIIDSSLTEESGSPQQVNTTASYAAAGRHKVAVVKVMIDGRQRVTMIFGPTESELVTVVCGVDFADEVPLSTGPCYVAIRNAFGSGLIYY